MSFEILGKGKIPIKGWTNGVPVEAEALRQLENIANLPFVHSHVAVMPDVHFGKGATVGSVIATHGAIIPAAVGVDIGCGMIAVKTSLTASDLPDSLLELRLEIESAVPHGRTDNGGVNDRGAWGNPGGAALKIMNEMGDGLDRIIESNPKLQKAAKRAVNHLGTLGGGNHFVEICLDTANCVWVMLHSGSRGIGNAIGSRFIEIAKEDMRKYFINLPDADLSYLPEGTKHFDDYVFAVSWAQKFAEQNRRLMLQNVLNAMRYVIKVPFVADQLAVNCHHNYVNIEKHFGKEVFLTRKGAVSAKTGQLGIIPGSMGAKSFIVRGKGNSQSFNSCSHGAGRVMSRTEAKKVFTLDDHAKATAGIECRKDAEVIDETPGAYKDIDAVMAAQSDLVEVLFQLRQVLCVKG